MDQDDNTARGHRVPAVRSTAPAGTPYPVAPNPPPAPPPPSASQPRTVGGHTARLNIPEGEALDFDPLAPSSIPEPLPSRPMGGPPLSEPVSVTMGGTQRLQQVSPDEAAAARDRALREAAEEKRSGRRGPAPTVDMEQPLKAEPGPVDVPATDGKPSAATRPDAPVRADAEGPSTLSLLFAPLSVAVGLIFFAMGCMIALTVEGRLIRFTVTVPTQTVSLPLPGAPGSAAKPPPTPQAGGAAPAPTRTTAHPAAPTTPSAPTTGAAPTTSTGKPAVPSTPATVRPQGGGGKRPPIIF